jgi:hypothetical protein
VLIDGNDEHAVGLEQAPRYQQLSSHEGKPFAGGVGFADDDCVGLSEPLDGDIVTVRYVIRIKLRAEGRGAAMRGSYDGPAGRAPHKLARGVLRSAGFGLIALGMSLAVPGLAHADEGGVSFWFPGQFGSLAAVPQAPGWSLGILNVYESVGASGNVAAAREVTIGKLNPNINVNLNVSLAARPDLVLVAPSYAFATPVLGGQLDLSMGAAVGRSAGDVAGVLTVLASGLTAASSGLSRP